MLADDQVEIGVIGHAVAFVGRPLDLNDPAVRVPAATYVPRHVREQQELVDGMPDRPLSEHEAGPQLDGRRVRLDQFFKLRPQRRMTHRWHSLPMTMARPAEARRRDTRPLRGVYLSDRIAKNVGMLDQVALSGKRGLAMTALSRGA